MKRLRKTIHAGLLVKVVQYTPPAARDTPRQRTEKAKAATAIQKRLNFQNAQGKLELKLAANFSNKDFFCTYTYAPGQEPSNRKQVIRHRAQFVRRLRTQRRRRGQDLKWVFAPEHKHGEAKWHLHAVISSADPRLDIDEIRSLWPYGHVEISHLFDLSHQFNSWLDVARYMTKERPEDGKDSTPVGAQIYSCSRNLINPLTDRRCMQTEWVDSSAPIDVPENALLLETEERQNEFSAYRYVKYLTAPLFRQG